MCHGFFLQKLMSSLCCWEQPEDVGTAVWHPGVREGRGPKVRGQPSLASEVSKHVRKEVRKGGGRGEREEGRMKDEQKDVTARGVSYAPERCTSASLHHTVCEVRNCRLQTSLSHLRKAICREFGVWISGLWKAPWIWLIPKKERALYRN